MIRKALAIFTRNKSKQSEENADIKDIFFIVCKSKHGRIMFDKSVAQEVVVELIKTTDFLETDFEITQVKAKYTKAFL